MPSPPAPARPSTSAPRHIRLVFVSLLVDLIAFALLLPLLPTVLEDFRRRDTSGAYAALVRAAEWLCRSVGAPSGSSGVLIGGALGSLFSLLQFVVAPVTGALSDRYGRRPLLLACLLGICCSHALWTLAACSGSFALFVGARVLGGVSKGNVNLCTAIVADVTDSTGRGRGLAWVGVAFSLGFIIGPSIGGLMASWRHAASPQWSALDSAIPALTSLSLSLLNLLFAYGCMSESYPTSTAATQKKQQQQQRAGSAGVSSVSDYISPLALLQFRAVKCDRQHDIASLRSIGLVYFLYLLTFSGVEFTLPFHCHQQYGFSAGQQGAMFVYMGVVMATVQGGVARRVAPHRTHRVALWSLVLLVPAFLLLATAQSVATLTAALGLYAVSTALCVPLMTTVATRYGGAECRGVVTGVFRSLGALARAAGPLPASALYWLLGARVCYVWAAAAMLVPLLLLWRAQPLLQCWHTEADTATLAHSRKQR